MLHAGIARRTFGRFSGARPSSDPNFASVNLLVPGDPLVSGVSPDVSPLAAGSRGVFVNGNSVTGGYITRDTGNVIYTQDGVGGGIAMPFPAKYTFDIAFRVPDVAGGGCLFDMRPPSTDPGGMVCSIINSGLTFYDVTTALKATVTNVFTNNTRHLISIARFDAATTRIFADGVLVATFADASNYAAQANLFLLNTSYNTAQLAIGSQVQQIRSTLGVCRYTANFTPSLPFPRS